MTNKIPVTTNQAPVEDKEKKKQIDQVQQPAVKDNQIKAETKPAEKVVAVETLSAEAKGQKEIELLKQKNEEYLNGWKRARADYINFKRETEKRQGEMLQFSAAAIILEVIQIYNNYKTALQHLPPEVKSQDWAKGFEHIKKQFVEFLKASGLEEIKTVGEKFNPEMHEAIIHEAKEGFKTDIIFEEVQPGYTQQGRVLVAAKVKVAK